MQTENSLYTLPKILIIDDDEATSDVLYQFFKMTGYSCQTRPSVNNIIELIHEVQPNVIILDYLLPEVNGGDLCCQIKRETAFRNIPVIICSAYPKVLLSLGTYGSDAFIAKPFNLDDLMRTIEILLHRRAC